MSAPLVRPVIPAASERQEITRPGPVLYIDLDIPDGDYRGADPLAVFAANADRKAAADAAFDARPDRLWMAWEGD